VQVAPSTEASRWDAYVPELDPSPLPFVDLAAVPVIIQAASPWGKLIGHVAGDPSHRGIVRIQPTAEEYAVAAYFLAEGEDHLTLSFPIERLTPVYLIDADGESFLRSYEHDSYVNDEGGS
jgi:hypothetical protein